VKRREFITLLGGAAAAWPLAARAQQGERVRRVGVLSNFAESDLEAQSMVEALHQTLQELGWVEGRNLRFDHRWAAGNSTRIQAFAKALVALQPDVIVGHVTPAVAALQKETSTIPIVFIQVSDPIGAGFIANLAHPGGNITGFTTSNLRWWANGWKCSRKWRLAFRGSHFCSIRKRPRLSPAIAKDRWSPLRDRLESKRAQIPFTMEARLKA